MGTGIGEYCKRCGEQLNYDDGFEDGFCNRCYHIAKFEAKNVSERAFTREELELILDSIKTKINELGCLNYQMRKKMNKKNNEYIKFGLSFVNVDDLSAIEYISKKEEYSVYDNSKVGKDRFTYRIHLKTGVSFETTLIGEEELSVFDSLKLISKLLKEKENEEEKTNK